MAWLDLRTGYRCNNRCRFCDQGDRRERIADAPLAELVTLLVGGRAAGADAVWLAGGEVTLRPDLPALVEAARAAGFGRVGIQTNGRILAAAGAAERLRAAGLTDAVVALHAATPALHDWLTQAEGAHKQASVGLRRLVAAGVATRVNTVLTRSGGGEIAALAALVPRLGADGHRWILARPVGAAEAEWRMLLPRLALVRGPLQDALALAWSLRREAETVGVPLCVLGSARAAAADRLDAPATRRAFPAGMDEPPVTHRHGPPCIACPLRAACPGVAAGYVDRYGWDEIVAPVTASAAASTAPSAGPPPPRAG
ncbi:MAG: radical SAM protein, partial [Pseudomonadota bacterium]|nr:radical SAM protein [Pseudomonadota bacterium]